ncbi:MAG: glycoside hydrolase family 57 protein [Endomicrobiaceae bacterium]
MKKVYLAFLWHQHQPIYKNPLDNVYELPWVRLHATKDYYDMVAILDDYPSIKSNINLVPSLMMQLDEYSKGIAKDKFLDLTLKPALELSEDDKIFILMNFFMANWDTMVFPYNRYHQLLEKRGKQTNESDVRRILNYFKIEDIRDLQVWFNLSWFDPYWRKHDEFINSLYIKGRGFTEDEKHKLIDKQLQICGMIVAKHKELQDRGQIEISVTPFYHPILPLLCDTNNALQSTPNINLPKKRFSHKEDAVWHVENAVKYYESVFGRKPYGMWPSEGSVSNDVVRIASDSNIEWLATDESVLFSSYINNSVNRKYLFRPYNINIDGKNVNMIFRDHGLSDSIGFVYSKWNADDAVNDFINKVKNIGEYVGNAYEYPLVSIILDGENCWEYYKNDGWDFLSKLYSALEKEEAIETVKISDYLKRFPPKDVITNLKAGSWINGNFGIWIGHEEDNLAWQYLGEVRDFLTEYSKNHPDFTGTEIWKKVWQIFYAAEGSDWNWWYGDDHSSSNDEIFDKLFRQHLMAIYELLGQKIPDNFYKAIKRTKPSLYVADAVKPTALIFPVIDGRITNYFEWKKAGLYSVGHSGGSMHQVATLIKSFMYGFDLQNIYFNISLNIAHASKEIENLCFNINLINPVKKNVCAMFDMDSKVTEFSIYGEGTEETISIPVENIAIDSIIEMAIPLELLKLPDDYKNIEFTISVDKDNMEIERWPYQSSIVIPKPTEDFNMISWTV